MVIGVLAICFGLFFAWIASAGNAPIPREEAVAYYGEFESYETGKNYCTIYFTDGSCYSVYPHTERTEFRETMEELEEGTKLTLLVNPNNDYVVEVRTDSYELLNLEDSQAAIDAYDDGYIAIGVFACIGGVYLIFYAVASMREEKKARTQKPAVVALRSADMTVKDRILLEATESGYVMCYRRVKFVNELVINGQVYAERKGFLEFAHKLCARVGGHTIEAGYSADNFSYICFDGKVIKRKRRWF